MSKFMPDDDSHIQDECHVASMIILFRPENIEKVKNSLEQINYLEIFAEDPIGKIIAVIEAPNTRSLRDITTRVETSEGVMSASSVYHETMTEAEAEEILPIDQSPQETMNKIAAAAK
ncbi:chaperone NapD [Curvivirga sp.]|uniref:chaperone NapD n=1 Tax=Curvivirga sp. TaxID=2856848 RepID=UPI003B596F14